MKTSFFFAPASGARRRDRLVDHVDEPRLAHAALGDGEDELHPLLLQGGLVEHRDLDAALAADLGGAVGELRRVELVGGLVDEVAGDADGLAHLLAERHPLLRLAGELAGDDQRDALDLGLGDAIAGEILGEAIGAEDHALGGGALRAGDGDHPDGKRARLRPHREPRALRGEDADVGFGEGRARVPEANEEHLGWFEVAAAGRELQGLVFLPGEILPLHGLRQRRA